MFESGIPSRLIVRYIARVFAMCWGATGSARVRMQGGMKEGGNRGRDGGIEGSKD